MTHEQQKKLGQNQEENQITYSNSTFCDNCYTKDSILIYRLSEAYIDYGNGK